MLNDVYNSKILGYAGNIAHLGTLDRYDGSAVVTARICGSRVKVQLSLENGKISEFAHEVKACALGQASSAIMAGVIIGKTPQEIFELKDHMYQFLKEDGPAPSTPFDAFECLAPVKDYKNRHASTLLTFDAVTEALNEALAKTGSVVTAT